MSASRSTALGELITQLSALAAAVQQAIRTTLRSAASSDMLSAASPCLLLLPLACASPQAGAAAR